MIAIDSEFQSLIPPLTDDEYKRLEASIMAEGIRNPITTWNGTIIDGHNRYHICEEHGIDCPQTKRDFPSREAAKIWIIENQFGRRNLSPYDRAVLALQLEPLYAAEAKRRMQAGKANPSQNSDEGSRARTDEQLAKLAGTSRDTIRKVKIIETEAAKGNETAIEARDAVRDGEKSINRAFEEVRPKGKQKDERRICSICGKPINEGEAYDYEPHFHKKCRTQQHVIAQRKYRNPTIGDTSAVLTHTKDELRDSLLMVVQDMSETLQATIGRYETMSVKLKSSESGRILKALKSLTASIESIKE